MATPLVRLVLLAIFLQVLSHARTEEDMTALSNANFRAAAAEQKACSTADCVNCERSDLCDRACSEINGVKTCRCQCYLPCTDKSNCTGSTVGKAANCQKDLKACRVYYNIGACSGKGYPCADIREPGSGTATEEGIFFYKKCTVDADCTSSQKNCAKLGSKYMAKCDYFPAQKDRFCACVIATTTKSFGGKKCGTSTDCLECRYNVACDRTCLADTKGEKTCFCKCQQPCSSLPNCAINTELKDKEITRNCFEKKCIYATVGICTPELLAEYPCIEKASSAGFVSVSSYTIFNYNKCTDDDDCGEKMDTCDQVKPGIGCVPKCLKYNEKSNLCYCVCPGPLNQ